MRPVIGLIAGFLLILMLAPANAAERVPCWQVRQWVATYGKDAVRLAARARGIPDSEIAEAERRCFR